MPKQKTHRGAAKRFSFQGFGDAFFWQAQKKASPEKKL